LASAADKLNAVLSARTSGELEKNRRGRSQQRDAGAEGQRAQSAGVEDGDAADRGGGAVVAGAVAAVADGLFVAVADERGEVGEVAGVGAAAE
jgi:hypothetical protein